MATLYLAELLAHDEWCACALPPPHGLLCTQGTLVTRSRPRESNPHLPRTKRALCHMSLTGMRACGVPVRKVTGVPDAMKLATRVGVDLERFDALYAVEGIDRDDLDDESFEEMACTQILDPLEAWRADPTPARYPRNVEHIWLAVPLLGAPHEPRPACSTASAVWDQVMSHPTALHDLATDRRFCVMEDQRLVPMMVPTAADPESRIAALGDQASEMWWHLERFGWRDHLVIPPLELGVSWRQACRYLETHCFGRVILALAAAR